MDKKKEKLEILMIGLDSPAVNTIEATLNENGLAFHLLALNEISDLDKYSRRAPDAVFFFSNRQSQKTIQDIRKINLAFPRAAIIMVSARAEYHGIVSAFRAGIFDFLALPIEANEVRTIIYRLQLHEVIQSGKWNPERAVLHLFSKPENFSGVEEIAASLNQYLNLFFNIKKHSSFNSSMQSKAFVEENIVLNEYQRAKLDHFLNDPIGIIFGLKLIKNDFHFLIKTGPNDFSYQVGRNISDYPMHDVLSDYLSNVLKTSLSILFESKRQNEIRILALTDEVTGLFNQRKLLEDLNHYMARYPIDKQVFTLLFVDIDYFKNVNDQFGHVVGSQLLVDMAGVLKSQLRSSDLVYRYGGDEFIVLLPRSTVDESKKIALRISEAVKAAEFNIDKEKKYHLSLSIGIAEFPTDADSAKSIIEFADKMMYLSKKSGRGKVFHVTEVVDLKENGGPVKTGP